MCEASFLGKCNSGKDLSLLGYLTCLNQVLDDLRKQSSQS